MNREQSKLLKTKNNPNGITLIALVITIVVMLILAGVAISVLVDGDGLFTKTRAAAEEYKSAAEEEASTVSDLISQIDEYLLGVPQDVTLTVSKNIGTSFTLTATGESDKGIAKYEFYVDNMGTPYKTINSTENTVICEVTDRTIGTEYECKVIVYDIENNKKSSEKLNVTTITPVTATQAGIEIGDYINYKAGVWTEEDLTAMTTELTLDDGTTVTPSVHASVRTATSAANTTLPDSQGQFGGFVLGQSRDTNSKEFSASYVPDASGWRVWDISGNTITLISAGHPETYYHASGNSVNSIGILKKRDGTMYENQFAQTGSAHVLTGQEAANWYNDRFGTDYEIMEDGVTSSTFYDKTFVTTEPISVLENNSYFWLASAYSTNALFNVSPDGGIVRHNGNNAFGVRVLVSLKSDVCFEGGTGNGDVGSPWKIVGQE